MTARKSSAFERALGSMSPSEQARAQRLRDALRIRDDDALWAVCSIDRILQDELGRKCAEATTRAVRGELSAAVARTAEAMAKPEEVGNAPIDGANREILMVTLGSFYVAGAVCAGSLCFTLSSLVATGEAWWVPADVDRLSAFKYLVTAILTAPVGGLFFLCALVGLGVAMGLQRMRWGNRE